MSSVDSTRNLRDRSKTKLSPRLLEYNALMETMKRARTVTLTMRRKRFIVEFRYNWIMGVFGDVLDRDEIRGKLIRKKFRVDLTGHLMEKDDAITPAVVERWMENHNWIKEPDQFPNGIDSAKFQIPWTGPAPNEPLLTLPMRYTRGNYRALDRMSEGGHSRSDSMPLLTPYGSPTRPDAGGSNDTATADTPSPFSTPTTNGVMKKPKTIWNERKQLETASSEDNLGLRIENVRSLNTDGHREQRAGLGNKSVAPIADQIPNVIPFVNSHNAAIPVNQRSNTSVWQPWRPDDNNLPYTITPVGDESTPPTPIPNAAKSGNQPIGRKARTEQSMPPPPPRPVPSHYEYLTRIMDNTMNESVSLERIPYLSLAERLDEMKTIVTGMQLVTEHAEGLLDIPKMQDLLSKLNRKVDKAEKRMLMPVSHRDAIRRNAATFAQMKQEVSVDSENSATDQNDDHFLHSP